MPRYRAVTSLSSRVYTSMGPTLNYTFLFGGPLPWISPLGKRVNYSWHSKVLKDERGIEYLEVFQTNMKIWNEFECKIRMFCKKYRCKDFWKTAKWSLYTMYEKSWQNIETKRFQNVFVINSLLSIYHVRWLKKNFRINYSIDLIINLYFI